MLRAGRNQETSKPLKMPKAGDVLRREAPMESKATTGQVKYVLLGVLLEIVASTGSTAL